MQMEEFLRSHLIIKIGKDCPGYLYTEIIVDNPPALVEVVIESDCYISEILWWDRVRIGFGSQIGAGGPRDPRNPQDYYFSETFLSREFSSTTTKAEYLRYLQETIYNYPDCNLFPGFDIKPKIKQI